MKKTLIVSCYFKHNYGSMLQAYATQHFLDLNRIDNATINVSNLSDFSRGKRKYYFSQLFNFNFYKAKKGMINLKIKRKINKNLKRNTKLRDIEFDRFKKRYFKLSDCFSSYQELKDYCKSDAANVLLGSDQLWLPVNVTADYYTLSFVPDDIKKISFSTSFGVDSIPRKMLKKYFTFLQRFDCLSVREKSGQKIVKDIVDKDCDIVCDPTLLLDGSEWDRIIDDNRIIRDKYILCYFLGKAKEHRQFAEKIRELTGYKIVSINHCDEFVRYSDKYADVIPYKVGPSEWLNLIKNAEYVCTDSFHGTTFSLIFHKNFFSFKRFTKKTSFSTNSRIYSLLDIVGLKQRLLSGKETQEEVKRYLNDTIDYSLVEKSLKPFIESSKNYLLSSLNRNVGAVDKGIRIVSKSKCSGCTACENACPKNAIRMAKDEDGFSYPEVDQRKCINCHICEKVCPSLNLVKENKKNQCAYLIRNKDENVLKESTSGGAFSALASYILQNKGVVFGARFNDEYAVEHSYIEDAKDIYRFRNSKYVQSDLKKTFSEVKSFLEKGRFVLFSGTPCQIEGLKTFLLFAKTNIEKLYLVDTVCHSVPSPLVWEKYKEFRTSDDCQPVAFRDKEKYGYEYSQMSFRSKEGNKKYFGSEADPYFRAFLSDLSIRPSCEYCSFKKRYRESDLTLWDCFVIQKYDKTLDDNKGVTRCLTHSDKGKFLIEQIKNTCIVKEIDLEKALLYSREFTQSVHGNPKRKLFFEDVNKLDSVSLFKKWFPMNTKTKIKSFIRRSLEKMGLYTQIKRIAKAILKRQ